MVCETKMKFLWGTDDYEIYQFPDEPHCRSKPGVPWYWLCNKDGEGMSVGQAEFEHMGIVIEKERFENMIRKGLNVVLDQFFRSNH